MSSVSPLVNGLGPRPRAPPQLHFSTGGAIGAALARAYETAMAIAAHASAQMDDVLRAKALLRPERDPARWPPRPADSSAFTTNPAQISAVADASALTVDAFRSRFEAQGEPALLGGLMKGWAALPAAGGASAPAPASESASAREWTLPKLAARLGSVRCQCGETLAGETVALALDAFAAHCMGREEAAGKVEGEGEGEGELWPDRNPMLIFDAMLVETHHADDTTEQEEKAREEEGKDGSAGVASAPLSSDFAVPEHFGCDDFLRLLGVERPPHQWILLGPSGSGR